MKKRCIRAAHEHMLTNVRLLRGRTGNLNRLAVHDSLSVVEGPTGSSEVDLFARGEAAQQRRCRLSAQIPRQNVDKPCIWEANKQTLANVRLSRGWARYLNRLAVHDSAASVEGFCSPPKSRPVRQGRSRPAAAVQALGSAPLEEC